MNSPAASRQKLSRAAQALSFTLVTIDPVALRIRVYDWIVARGSPPTSDELADTLGVDPAEVRRALGAVRIGKTLLVAPSTGEIWMAGPFSATETSYQVIGARTRWFANCAWDMLGVAIIVSEPVRIEARCTDCAAPIQLRVDPGRPPREDCVVHFLVPARRWYDDIGFT
jgi:hypothetical protein